MTEDQQREEYPKRDKAHVCTRRERETRRNETEEKDGRVVKRKKGKEKDK